MKFVGKANSSEEIKEEKQNKEIYLSGLISFVVRVNQLYSSVNTSSKHLTTGKNRDFPHVHIMGYFLTTITTIIKHFLEVCFYV